MQDHQRHSPAAHQKVLKRHRPTDGRTGLAGTIPTRFIVPEREDGPGRPVAIERRPEGTNCMLESIETA